LTALQTSAPRLEVRNLSRSFAGRSVVQDVSLTVSPGQVTCLLGPSGCGKSTTLRMIAGVEAQDAGEIYVDGALVSDPIHQMPPEQRQIGLMFQDFALFPHLTVAGNVGFGLSGRRAQQEDRITELLDRVGLAPFADAYPSSLSGGEQQRVALARALAPRPKIMLMDEPFSGLDNRLRDGIRDETLALLKEENTAVLLVTHEPEEAMRMADEVALMRDGQIVQMGAPYNIYNRPMDRDAMAFFSDVNALQSVVEGAIAHTPFGRFLAPGYPDGSNVDIVFRPQHLRIDFDRATPPPSTPGDGTPARAEVQRARFLGHESLVELVLVETGTALKAVVPQVFLPKPGTILYLRVPRDRCFVFPRG